MTKKNTFVGTPFWMAPEVIKQSGYDQKADIWSLGITALELAKGEPPYSEIHPMKVLFLIPKNPPPNLQGDYSKPFKDFVDLCLKRLPAERPNAKELLKHPFIRRAKKTTYLTELIERQERWQAVHGDQISDADSEDANEDSEQSNGENQDLWDFGTVRPAGGRVAGLTPLNASATNARAYDGKAVGPSSRSPDRQVNEKIKHQRMADDTVNSRATAQFYELSPKRAGPTTSTPLSPSLASKVPLPPSPTKQRLHESSQILTFPQASTNLSQPQPSSTDMSTLNLGLMENAAARKPPYKTDQDVSIIKPKPSKDQFQVLEIPPYQASPRGTQAHPLPILPAITSPRPKTPSLRHAEHKSPSPRQQQSMPKQSFEDFVQDFKNSSLTNITNQSNHHDAVTPIVIPPPTTNAIDQVTTLSDTILPALYSALKCRERALHATLADYNEKFRTATDAQKPTLMQDVSKLKLFYEKLGHHCTKIVDIFADMEMWDDKLKADVKEDGFFDKFLEEILLKVE